MTPRIPSLDMKSIDASQWTWHNLIILSVYKRNWSSILDVNDAGSVKSNRKHVVAHIRQGVAPIRQRIAQIRQGVPQADKAMRSSN